MELQLHEIAMLQDALRRHTKYLKSYTENKAKPQHKESWLREYHNSLKLMQKLYDAASRA